VGTPPCDWNPHVNLVGDSINALLRHDPITLIGLPIGGLMIWYLVQRRGSF